MGGDSISSAKRLVKKCTILSSDQVEDRKNCQFQATVEEKVKTRGFV